ncbi:transposase [Pandoraea communis]|uniref:Transposase n=1 Tax=Pandoraea communis TaxID=2508297 RepID=A0A5E4RAG0_9BURK|nr:transposase [Pandoraea communis]
MYPVVFFDAMRVKIREDAVVRNKAVYLALRSIAADWDRAAKDWKTAMKQLAILYADRFVRPSV